VYYSNISTYVADQQIHSYIQQNTQNLIVFNKLNFDFLNIFIETVIKKGIQLNNRKLANTVLYVYYQILMAISEDDLQTMT
jgi:hypothetical protein